VKPLATPLSLNDAPETSLATLMKPELQPRSLR
jgi:hypothetical protein